MTAHRIKPCLACGVPKVIDAFYCRRTAPDGHMNECKECVKHYNRERHWLKRDSILARKRIYAKTPKARAARAAYAKSARGKVVMAESKKTYRILRRMDEQQVVA